MQLSPITFTIFVAALIAAHVLARGLTRWARGVALRHGIVSLVTARSSHSEPTARLGGLGLGLAYGLAAAGFFGALWLAPRGVGWIVFLPPIVGWMALGWALMFLTGLLDDLFDLNPAAKMGLMFLATLPPVLGADLVPPLPNLWLLPTWMAHGLAVGLAILWILYFTNGFNFMDGMDGFAASFFYYAALTVFAFLIIGTLNLVPDRQTDELVARFQFVNQVALAPLLLLGFWGILTWMLLIANGLRRDFPRDWQAAELASLVACGLLALLLVFSRQFHAHIRIAGAMRGEACVLLIAAMACSGFLRWNQPPARVFMGDGGSLALGYLLALAALLGANRVFGQPLPLLTSLTILMPFIFDVTLTILRRIRLRQKIWQAHREHLYQRLLRAGFTHRQVLWINVRRFAICGLAGLLNAWQPTVGRWLGLTGEEPRLAGPRLEPPPSNTWAWIGVAIALAVMIDYWQRVLTAERRAAELDRSKDGS